MQFTPFIYEGIRAEKALRIIGKEVALGAVNGSGELVLPKEYDRIENIYMNKVKWEIKES